jgi:hypothetical protein
VIEIAQHQAALRGFQAHPYTPYPDKRTAGDDFA